MPRGAIFSAPMVKVMGKNYFNGAAIVIGSTPFAAHAIGEDEWKQMVHVSSINQRSLTEAYAVVFSK